MTTRYSKPTHTAKQALSNGIDEFKKKVIGGMKMLKLSKKRRRNMKALMGEGYYTRVLMHSDFEGRKKCGEVFIKVMSQHRQTAIASITVVDDNAYPLKFYLLTFCHDLGNTSDRRTEFHIGAFKQRVDRAIRSLNIDAIAILEIQPIMNYPEKDHGRTLMLHAHAIGWTSNDFDPKAAEE